MDFRARPTSRASRRRTHTAHQPRALDIAPLASADFLRETAAPVGRLADLSTVDLVMRLQRTVGNANLQRLLQRDPRLPSAPARPTRAASALTHPLVAAPAELGTPPSKLARLVETYAQRDPRRRRRRGGRRGGSTSTSTPTRKPSFTLTNIAFVVDGTSIVPKRGTKTAGWNFTSSGSGAFAASRAMPSSAYIDAAGTDTQFQQQTTIHVAGTSARADALNAVMSSGGTPQVTITLNSTGHGTTKSVAVGPESVDSLDLTLGGGFTPKAGDAIHLASGKRVEVFVFSSLKDATGKSVSGFFDLGRRTKIQGGFGVEGRDAAPFDSTFTKLKSQNLLNADILANQDVFSMTSEIEGGFATVQSADTGVVSFGFGQWTAMSDLPKMLKRLPATTFQQHLGQYGLGVGTPTLGAFAQTRKFIPGGSSALNAAVKKLHLHNATEGCLILDGKELVSEAMRKTATDWSTRHDTVMTRLGTIKSEAAAAQADVTSGNAAKATSGRTRLKALDKEVNAAWKKLAGLPGVAARVPSGTAVDAKVNTLIKGVTDAKTAADQVVSNTGSVELLRTNEWVLRFQVAGGDPTVQTAQLEEAQATLDRIDAMTFGVTNGVSIGKLLPSQRAQALLFSTFLNSQVGITRGVPRAISAFKDEKVAAAPPGSQVKEDWKAFVWPQSDPRWARLFTDANKARLEELAEDKLLPFTFDPARRRRILAARFPP